MRGVALFVLGMIVLSSCSSSTPDDVLRMNRGRTQGTTYNISYIVPEGIDYQSSIDSILFAVDRSLSAWVETSTLSKVNIGELDSVTDPLFLKVMRAGQRVSRETNGAFDMTVGPLVNYWGFGAEQRSALDSAKVDSLIQLTGYYKFRVEQNGKLMKPRGMKLDVNAIAQGFSVDLIAEWLNSKGVQNYLVEVGGEMRSRGESLRGETWVIGIDKPSEQIQEERFQVIIRLDSAALATSGNYRKFFVDTATGVKYSHTIDPQTGYPARDRLLSVSIITGDCMRADAYATACMVMGLDKAKAFVMEQDDVEAYFVFSSLTGEWEVWSTEGFEAMVK